MLTLLRNVTSDDAPFICSGVFLAKNRLSHVQIKVSLFLCFSFFQ